MKIRVEKNKIIKTILLSLGSVLIIATMFALCRTLLKIDQYKQLNLYYNYDVLFTPPSFLPYCREYFYNILIISFIIVIPFILLAYKVPMSIKRSRYFFISSSIFLIFVSITVVYLIHTLSYADSDANDICFFYRVNVNLSQKAILNHIISDKIEDTQKLFYIALLAIYRPTKDILSQLRTYKEDNTNLSPISVCLDSLINCPFPFDVSLPQFWSKDNIRELLFLNYYKTILLVLQNNSEQGLNRDSGAVEKPRGNSGIDHEISHNDGQFLDNSGDYSDNLGTVHHEALPPP